MIWPGLLVILGLLLLVLFLIYRRWLSKRTRLASAESHIAQTTVGPVEYDCRGEGPVVLHFHGGNVGHNGWFTLDYLLDAGFSLLTPDRPGYLGTSLGNNGSPEAQADLAAALLDELDIDIVAVVGVSAGGPGAIQFAARHPERTQALVLMAAISQRTMLTADQLNSALGRLVMSPRFQDPAYFFINVAMKRLPRLTLQEFARTETTYVKETGQQLIEQILADPMQREQVVALADAMVPALPRFDGVANDLAVQQSLDPMPLTQIEAPTLIIHSRHDGDVPYSNATHAAAHIPNATLMTVDQFGHMLWWGDPQVTDEFQDAVSSFLAEHVNGRHIGDAQGF